MKITLFSDLHLEIKTWTPPESARQADVVILAGDICCQSQGIPWAARSFNQPVLYVSGNHEFYGVHLGLLRELRECASGHVHFLERDMVVIGDVRFLGCTLWSSFDLHGGGEIQIDAINTARRSIGDYFDIAIRPGQRLEPRHTFLLHRQSANWLDKTLSEPFSGKTVVITHFAPHRGCIPQEHQKSKLSPYFVSDMSWLMKKHRIDLWCHSHTHRSTDFVAENGCRVVSNQFGYPNETEKSGFRQDLPIDL